MRLPVEVFVSVVIFGTVPACSSGSSKGNRMAGDAGQIATGDSDSGGAAGGSASGSTTGAAGASVTSGIASGTTSGTSGLTATSAEGICNDPTVMGCSTLSSFPLQAVWAACGACEYPIIAADCAAINSPLPALKQDATGATDACFMHNVIFKVNAAYQEGRVSSPNNFAGADLAYFCSDEMFSIGAAVNAANDLSCATSL
jgi:hypothetical protein